ncbi:MAG: AAA family ATPase [Vicinamibacterales bacterium]
MEQVTAALRRREGLIVVTGAIGTGKTMLCRSMLESFEPRTFLSVILDPGLEVEDLLRTVLTDFGIVDSPEAPAPGSLPAISRHQFVTALHRFLSSLVPLHAHAVIMIDEAQRLNASVLEEIRLLSNFETDEAKLLQIVLVGQPELDEMLGKPEMQQLNQRVSRRCELQPLSESEVGDYIERRLTVAASPGALAGKPDAEVDSPTSLVRFAPEAVHSVAAISRGTPRVVNTLCDRALDVAFERHLRVVDAESVAGAAARLHLDNPGQLAEAGGRRFTWFVIALILILGALVATWLWLPKPPTLIQSPGSTPPAKTSVASTPSSPSPSPSSSIATGSAPAVPTAALPGSSSPAGAAGSTTPGVSNAGAASAPVAPLSTTPTTPANPGGSAAARPGSYQITVASFRTEQRAQDVAAAISKQQVPAVVRTDATGTWFQVIAGPFTSREAAVAAQSQIALSGFQGTQVSPVVADVH